MSAVRRWCVVVLASGAFVVMVLAGPATAETVDVVADSSPVQLVSANFGEHAAKIGIANVSDEPVTFSADTVNRDPDCTITPSPRSIDPATQATITFTFDTGCSTDGGIDFFIEFADPATPSSIEYRAKPAPAATDKADWSILEWSAIASLLVALATVVAVALYVAKENLDADRKSELGGLGTSWSFKDSWIANITVGATVLVGLLGASNVLKSVLGKEPTAALGVMAVASAVAALLVGIAPLILKGVGKDPNVPTYGGVLLAAFVVIGGSMFQITAVTVQAARLADTSALELGIQVGGVLVALIVLNYAVKSLVGFVKKGAAKPPAPPIPPEIQAALLIVAAIQPPTKATQDLTATLESLATTDWTPPVSRSSLL